MNGLTELFLYSSIRDYIYARIEFFTEHVLSQNLKLAIATILGLLTVWVMIQGYLMATGRSQEGIKGFVFNLGKNYLVILVALSFAAGGSFSVRAMTDKFTDNISEIMSGDAKAGSVCLTRTKGNVATGNTLSCKIDRNLTATQAIMGVMNSIDTADDPVLEENIANAKWFAGIGSAGPSVVAGSMLIIFRIAMALFIGCGPIFILCLLFKKTAPLFQKWLYYGLATIFSGVLLGVMAEISMDLASKVATSLFITDTASYIITGEGAAGVMQAATQQLGLGLILSTLLIVVPPMAGLWFNGMMGSFSPYSAFSGWNPQSASSGGMSGSTQVAGALPPGIAGGAQTTQIQQNKQNMYTGTNQASYFENTMSSGITETSANVHSNQVKTFEQAKQSAGNISAKSKDE